MNLDVIGIGALNFDYICPYKPALGEASDKRIESGTELLDYSEDELEKLIRSDINRREYEKRFGGSAYLTIKTVAALGQQLRTGFVGVAGLLSDLESDAGFKNDFLDSELAFLDSREWCFTSSRKPGRALIRLNYPGFSLNALINKGMRNSIRISSGANDELLERITERERSAEPLEYYLASARWVHITSLGDIRQFEAIIERVKIAKQLNRFLKVSIDPGYQYTEKYRELLKRCFPVADYVFLNENEFDNLKGGHQYPLASRIDWLKSNMEDHTQIFVLKQRTRTVLYQCVNSSILTKTYWHRVLAPWEVRDDTGAGDVFAAGVIVGLLIPELLAHQPACIELGSNLAATKLRSVKFPTKALADAAARFLEKGMAIEEKNGRQRIKVVLGSIWAIIVGFAISFVAGLASGVLLMKCSG